MSRSKPSLAYAMKGTEKKKSFWEKALDVTQVCLDVAGLIPGIGEIADLANAGIYLARGDYTNASLSAAAAIHS